MANAMYCLTRVLRQQGYDAEYVEDGQDAFPMSQPIWEEVPLILDPSRFGSELLDPQGWRELAAANGWEEPPWIVHLQTDPRKTDFVRLARSVRWTGVGDPRPLYRYLRTLEPVVERLRTYDRLVVCGIRNVEAMLSGDRTCSGRTAATCTSSRSATRPRSTGRSHGCRARRFAALPSPGPT